DAPNQTRKKMNTDDSQGHEERARSEDTGQSETTELELRDGESVEQDEPKSESEAELVCGYRLHPAAAVFPRLAGDDLQRLIDDIKRNRLRRPIVLHPDDNSVLDGVNRLLACEMARIEPTFMHWQGKRGQEVDFVISKNLARRHLSESQRAVIANRLA